VILPEPIVKGKDLVYQLLSIAGTVVHKTQKRKRPDTSRLDYHCR
jgi:hypothetical protein